MAEIVVRKPPRPPLHFVGEPKRTCGNCQHSRERLCRNGISGRTTVRAADTACDRGFYPDVKRFPLEVRYHQGEQR